MDTNDNNNVINPIVTDHPIYDSYLNRIDAYWSFEGYIVAMADEIAQRHHDIEDGLRYGIMDREELVHKMDQFQNIFGRQERICIRRLRDEMWALEEPVFNALFARLVVNLYVTDVISTTRRNIENFEEQNHINNLQDFQQKKVNIAANTHEKIVSMSTELKQYDENFHEFLKNCILSSYQAQAMDGKAGYIVRKLYEAFTTNPEQLPDTSIFSYARFLGLPHNVSRADVLHNHKNDNQELLHRCIADYIGGMTDQFAYDEFDRLYGTRI